MITIYWTTHRTDQLPEGGDRSTMTFDSVDIDIVESDKYDVAAKISMHAAEVGVDFADHVLPENDRVQFTAIVSDRQSNARLVENARSGVIQISDGIEASGIVVPEGTTRSSDVHTILRRLCREGIEIDIDGLQRPIEGWMIERVSTPRSVETAGLLVADVSAVEIRYAEVEEVDAPSPRVERGRRRRDQGRSQQTESAETTTTRSQSAVRSITGDVSF